MRISFLVVSQNSVWFPLLTVQIFTRKNFVFSYELEQCLVRFPLLTVQILRREHFPHEDILVFDPLVSAMSLLTSAYTNEPALSAK